MAQQKQQQREEYSEVLVRIYGHDLPGSKYVSIGLTKIKGISWAISNAACIKLSIPRNKKISDLSKDEIKKIEDFLDKLEGIPPFLKNRRSDPESGKEEHLYSTDLDMRKDFDIKRLRKIKSYRGLRHATGQPSRGQRTRSHFRSKGKAVGVKRKGR